MSFAVPQGGNVNNVTIDGESGAELAARLETTNPKRTKEFLGMENINGYECHHYRYTSSDVYQETWVFEPLRLIMQRMEGNTVFVLQNLQLGPQSDNLFEIPKDYTADKGGLGGLLDVLTGKPGTEDQKGTGANSELDKLQKALKLLQQGAQKK